MNLNSSSFYLSSESIDMENNDLYDYVPSFIFKVNYTNKNNDPEEKLPRCIQHNLEFEKLKKEYGSFYGYHGSLFENFHSILHYGLQTNLNKVYINIYIIEYYFFFFYFYFYLNKL